MVPTEYRPTFIFWTSFLAQLPLQLFFTVWAGGFFGGIIGFFLPNAHFANPALIVGVTVFVLFPAATLIMKRFNYKNTAYRVFSDRLEIEEGFLTQHRKELLLSSVREINLRRGILQRFVGLGSVYLATQATGQGQWWQSSAIAGGNSTFGSGAMLMDLANYNVAYEQIRQLLDAQSKPGK